MLFRLRSLFALQAPVASYSRIVSTICVALCLLVLTSVQVCYGQVDGGAGGGDGGADGGDDGSTIGTGITSGVSVDADGVLRGLTEVDASGQLVRQRIQEALAQLDSDIAKPSKLRKVSLTRLARLIKKAIAEGHGPDEAMKHQIGRAHV